MKYDALFWDWNGTLVDDVDYNIDCINHVIRLHGYTCLERERYLEIFGFPIIDFYRKLGFDFRRDDYKKVADEYIAEYNARADEIPLRQGVREALAVYRDKGIPQYILTASETKIVEHGLKCRGIDGYFNGVVGLDNFLAGGKAESGKRFLAAHPEIKRSVLIGDTAHDLEAARSNGMDCILLTGGHATNQSLSAFDVPIVSAPNQTYRYVLPTGRETRKTVCDVSFVTKYKAFYDDLKNTSKTEDW